MLLWRWPVFVLSGHPNRPKIHWEMVRTQIEHPENIPRFRWYVFTSIWLMISYPLPFLETIEVPTLLKHEWRWRCFKIRDLFPSKLIFGNQWTFGHQLRQSARPPDCLTARSEIRGAVHKHPWTAYRCDHAKSKWLHHERHQKSQTKP